MGLTSDMNYQTRLHIRGSNCYFRAKIPADLRSFCGKAEIKYSLGTKDRKKAVRLVRQKSVELDQEFDHISELSEALSGRASKETGRHYGDGFSLSRLRDAINRIQYSGVELPVIIPEDDC